MKKSAIVVVTAFVALFAASTAFAAQQTASLNASATVIAVCAVSASPVNFGTYSGQFVAAQGQVSVNCSPGTTFTVLLGPGGHRSGVWRRMASGSSFLNYRLNREVPGSLPQEWGDGSFGTTQSGTTSGTWNVLGSVPGGQTDLPAGAYSDVVVVTLNY